MLFEKGVSITMANKGGAYFPIHCQGVELDEIDMARGVLDMTPYYKSVGYTLTREEETFYNNEFTLPTAIVMTGKKDKNVYIKLKNGQRQNIFMGFKMPLGTDESAIRTLVTDMVGSNISGFGAVTEAYLVVKN